MIIAYRVLVALGVALFLIGLANLALDYQLGSFQLSSVLLATGGIVCTGFASIMVDDCKIRAKTAWHIAAVDQPSRPIKVSDGPNGMLRLSSEFAVNLCSKSLSEADKNMIKALEDTEAYQHALEQKSMVRLRHRGAILINENGLHSTDGKRITMTEARKALGLYQ